MTYNELIVTYNELFVKQFPLLKRKHILFPPSTSFKKEITLPFFGIKCSVLDLNKLFSYFRPKLALL